MSKAEYLDELKKMLEEFGGELQQEILEDYVQHFAEGEATGKTDEEIIEELGAIEDMIDELREAKQTVFAPAGNAEEQKRGEGAEASNESANVGKELPDPQSGIVRNKFSKICLNTNSTDIVIEESEDEWIHAEFRCDDASLQERFQFYQYGEGDTFYAGIRPKHGPNRRDYGFGPAVIVSVENRLLKRHREAYLVVKVPAGETELKFASQSGDVRMERVRLKKVNGTTVSGDVSLDACAVNDMNIMTSSGDIYIDKAANEKLKVCTASGDTRITHSAVVEQNVCTNSGDVVMEHGSCDSLHMMAASGDLTCRASVFRQICAMSSSGDIDLDAAAQTYELTASSGDITVRASQAPEMVKASTSSGDIQLNLGKMEDVAVDVFTRGGDVRLHHNGNKEVIAGKGTRVYGNGSRKVSAKTSSGDIDIKM